ncbi:hypothetical protein [Actinoplanes xinjiangensis]|uniref:hypothetical protein n=1 Tax=Actinoplanes xinjiangensis TaxID=512350 RepID=UPI003438C0CF
MGNWIRQAKASAGERYDRSTSEMAEKSPLREEVAELRQAYEILRAASSCFASELGPTRQRSRGLSTNTMTASRSPSCYGS